MFGLLSLLACIGSIAGAGSLCSLNDAAFVRIAAEIWEHTKSYTAGDGSAYMLWASALLLHIHDLYSISSDLINSILSAYDQYLQEAGGDNELLIKAKAYMATVKHGQRNQHAYSIVLPSGLPHEIRQTTPEHFLVVDSGATVHCLWNAIMTAFLREQNSAINWGVGHSVCIAIGHLCGVTFCKINDVWSKIILTSGYADA